MRRQQFEKIVNISPKWIEFSTICASILILNVILNMPAPLVTSIARETGWSLGDTGYLVSAFNLFSGLCTFFSGPLVDRIGSKRTVLFSLAMVLPAGILTMIGKELYPLHLLGRMIAGAGYGLIYPVPGAIVAEEFEEAQKPVLLGIRSTVDFIGCTLSFYCMIPLYHLLQSWQFSFGLWYLLLAIPLAILLSVRCRDPKKEAGTWCNKADHIFASVFLAAKEHWVWQLTAIQIGSIIPFYAFGTFYPSYLEMELHFSVSTAAGIAGLMQIIGIIAGVFSGKLSEVCNSRKILAWGTVLGILTGIWIMLTGKSVFVISAGALLMGFAVCMYTVFVSLVPADILGSEQTGFYVASISIVLGVSSILGFFIPTIFQGVLNLGMSIRIALAVFSLPTVIAIIPVAMIKETAPR